MPTATRSTAKTVKSDAGEDAKGEAVPRLGRASNRCWINVSKLEVSPLAQREMRPNHVNRLVIHYDATKLGVLHVNHRAGRYFVMDGQHRVEMLRAVGEGDSDAPVELYEGLSEQQEADMFLELNNQLTVGAYDKFKVGIAAGRPEESAIAEILEGLGMKVALGAQSGSIGSVTTLRKVYRAHGPDILRRSLQNLIAAFGDHGRDRWLIEGMALVLSRFERLTDERVVTSLLAADRGATTVIQGGKHWRESIGRPRAHCYAAAIVDQVNKAKGSGGKNLPTWWHAKAPASLSPLRQPVSRAS